MNQQEEQQKENPQKTNFAQVREADVNGIINDLEPGASYFVVKRPTTATNGKTKEVVDEIRGLLHEQRVFTQKQLAQLNERLGDPRERIKQVRENVEKKVDEVARKLESQYEKLENELEQNLDRILKREKEGEAPTTNGATPAPETPGEMPTGEHDTPSSEDAPKTGGKKKGQRKGDGTQAE